MKQKISWPVALLVIGALFLVLAAFYHRSVSSGSEGRISPQFLQLSPAEQKAALMNAERARRLRGARPSGMGQ
jgi:hypothetical protein